MPDPNQRRRGAQLTGDVPDPSNPPPGCRFHTRCPRVIQPADVDLDQPEWRALMDLRVRLREHGIDVEAVRSFVGMQGTGEAAAADETSMRRAIRSEFDLPDRLSDPRAEAVLGDALDRVLAGESEAARALLADAFATPCEQAPPAEDTAGGHLAACHLHDERYAPAADEPAE